MKNLGILARHAIVLALVVVQSAAAQAKSYPRIVNGTQGSAFPTTGALLKGSNADTASSWCSGTLIGCNTFLTAGHCVADDLSPSAYRVFLQSGGIFSVTHIDLHPSYNFPVADVAVLTLGEAVTGIRPTAINTIEDPPFGTPGEIAGFGRSGGGVNNRDYGIKRYGEVTTGSCASSGESDTTSVCWTFDSPQGAPGSNSNTCNGDSGGPLYLDLGGHTVVAGITSGGVLDTCFTGDASFDADVYYYRAFIQSKAGSDLDNTFCGTLPQVGDSDATVTQYNGTLSGSSAGATHSFAVPLGIAEMRVTLNGVDDGSDFDLYVKQGSAPTTNSYNCARIGGNQFGSCTFTNPASDTWYVWVRRYSGSGAYQVTLTEFGHGCSDPANNGYPCDDENPCTTNDACNGGTCTGSNVADGTSCGAGTLCSGPSTCQAGACSTNPTPAVNCKQTLVSHRSAITIKDSINSSADKVQWKWKGQETLDFGNPTTSTNYALCVYDQSAGSPRLALDLSIPAGLGWLSSISGFKYTDTNASSDGVRSVKLHYGIDDKASIIVAARGAGVGLPTKSPLDQSSAVLVQLVTNSSRCWEAHYGSTSGSTPSLFHAKSD